MSASVKPAVRPPSGVRVGPLGIVLGASIMLSVAIGGFAVGRSSSGQQVLDNPGSVSVGAERPVGVTITSPATWPTSRSAASQHRQNHHTKQKIHSFAPGQAVKDCAIHRAASC
jgi:hypothetical protein